MDYFEADVDRSTFTCDVIKAQNVNTLTFVTRFITNFHTAPLPTRSMGKTLKHVRMNRITYTLSYITQGIKLWRSSGVAYVTKICSRGHFLLIWVCIHQNVCLCK